MRRHAILAATSMLTLMNGCALVLDFDGFEVSGDADGGALDGSPPDADGGPDRDGEVPDGCVAADEVCNGVDDDCDGAVDEEGFADDDPSHCGGCGIACGEGHSCASGVCTDEVVDLALGGNHTCALLQRGEVWCFGANDQGQLGLGTPTEAEAEPQHVTALTGVVDVGAGGRHSCAVTGDQVWCWGENARGQLADDSFTGRPAPRMSTGGDAAREVAGGAAHTCLWNTSLQAKCAGNNDFGQIGLATGTENPRFAQAGTLGSVQAIATGANHSCALVSGGGVRCWGDNSQSQLGVTGVSESSTPITPLSSALTSGVRAIATGGNHTCVITADRDVLCWGSDAEGQLGTDVGGDTATPQAVALVADAQAIAAGGSHTCAVIGDAASARGEVWCWGSNDRGQLGDGTGTDSPTPVRAASVDSALPVLGAGDAHTCVVERSAALSGPQLRCWGFNAFGQVGVGSRSPSDVTAPRTALLP